MEKNGASSSTINQSPQQSLWLQQTLSDLNTRMQDMMTLLKEDENFSVRTEIYPAKRLQIFQMLDEFRDSYCSLAETYDQLSSNAAANLRLTTSFSHSNKQKPFEVNEDSIMEDTHVESDNSNFDFPYLNTLVEELMSTELSDMKMNSRKHQCEEKTTNVPREDSLEDASWSDLNSKVSELMHENFHQLAELARRNIEKRVMINRLQLQLEILKDENRALRSYTNQQKVREKQKQFQIPKLKRLVFSKFFRPGS